MITNFEEIVNIEEIGKQSSQNMNDIVTLAHRENLPAAENDETKVLLLGIDFQNDFMDHGSLGVSGAHKDVERLTKFVYKNLHKITKIGVSIDTHKPLQIFHQSWWQDQEGNNPNPYTIISAEDVHSGKWVPIYMQEESINYVENLDKLGKKQLCIWPYHCIQGTFGCSLEGQFANLINFHSAARKTDIKTIVKGLIPDTEMYGIFRPEYSPKNLENQDLLREVMEYDKIIIAGEAKSHCVIESVVQLLDYCTKEQLSGSKIYILEDCMSSITGFGEETNHMFTYLANKHGIQLVKTTDFEI